ncbi:MAG: Fic family protein [Candidatus Tectomicrobia bacterium]|nr:Fic family protein [Candidatus Tectomicrobia bacterium]
MAYIHERPRWPNFTWDSEVLSPMLAALRYRQGRLLGRMQALGFDLKMEANLHTLTNEVVKSSAIEGEKLNPEAVRSSLARRLGLDAGGLAPAGRDVEGVVEMMLDATQHHEQELTSERLCAWHAALFPTGRSGMRRITVGAWRPKEVGPMQVVSGQLGRETVHFEAPAAERLDTEMRRFLDWFNGPTGIDSVLKAGLAHFWFVTIHPFEDGNGRIARAIADLALARADGSKERFYSMSSRIDAERNAYYEHLEAQQRNDLDVTAWLAWFLGCLDRAIESAEETLQAVLYKAKLWETVNRRPVNDRQRQVVNRMLDSFQGHLNTSKYAKLAKCSTDTALRDIRELLDRGILIRNPGGGRSTSYRLARIDELA